MGLKLNKVQMFDDSYWEKIIILALVREGDYVASIKIVYAQSSFLLWLHKLQ